MKKLTTVALSLSLVASLAGCGSSTDSAQSSTDSAQNDSGSSTSTSEPVTDATVLVAYYSATGTTAAVAEQIAAATGGDLFEIEAADPYSDDDLDWTDNDSRVSREHDDPDSRDVELVSAAVDGWDSYDVVFIGYPIWWGIAAWPTSSFVVANDFTGKTVVPFCTSSSSGLGSSGTQLAELAGTGDWLEGQRFGSSTSDDDVRSWVEGLGL
ncbi:flavodoxin [Bifidobacterium eulemuris]|uniref:Flavodoxin n=1 Tax=Bifidobacterium eulemuris TaxID=1765219 RepID=A0A261G7Y5_9BIFI|nr:flavodoxin [Bifidobacterium eulemuris]OZG67547.1 flavodoxin [Bifidobacterium eulemuris]QOL31083.1 flavodoxin [Bifidobacterium eulemuris]